MREDSGGGAVRLVTKNVLDGVGGNKDEKYELVSVCPTARLADVIMDAPRSGTQQQAALAVIARVGVSKEFMVEAVQLVAEEAVNSVAMTMKKLIKLSLRMKCREDCERPSWESGSPPFSETRNLGHWE